MKPTALIAQGIFLVALAACQRQLPPQPAAIPANVNAIAPASPTPLTASNGTVTDIGRIEYEKITPSIVSNPTSDDYVSLRLNLQSIGGDVTYTSDAGFWQKIGAKVFVDNTKSFFVGLRFESNQFDIPDSTAQAGSPPSATATSALPFITVLNASKSSSQTTPPETYDNIEILSPRPISAGAIDVQIALKWGTQVSTTLPGTILEAAKIGAGLVTGLPVGLTNLIAPKITGADRQAADTFFETALSTDSSALQTASGPNGINTYELVEADLLNGSYLKITVFDRDARDPNRQAVIQFTLTPQYATSLLPGAPSGIVSDPTTLYGAWGQGDYQNNLQTGNANTSAANVLSLLPNGLTQYIDPLNDKGSFNEACQLLPDDFAQLGYNVADRTALTWAFLQNSQILASVPALTSAAQSALTLPPECPTDKMNTQFSTYGLPTIASAQTLVQLRIPANVTLEQQRLSALEVPFAEAWAQKTSFQKFIDPQNPAIVIQQSGTPLFTQAGPLTSDQLISQINGLHEPTLFQGFSESNSSSDLYCITITSQDGTKTLAKGGIIFEPNEIYIKTLEFGKPVECLN